MMDPELKTIRDRSAPVLAALLPYVYDPVALLFGVSRFLETIARSHLEVRIDTEDIERGRAFLLAHPGEEDDIDTMAALRTIAAALSILGMEHFEEGR